MKRALFVSKNLIGDMLNAGVAIREWFKLHRDNYDEVDLMTNLDHVTKLYHGLGIKWNNTYTGYSSVEELNEYGNTFDKVFNLGAGEAGAYCDTQKCHIIEGFCHQLDDISPPQVEVVNTPFGTFKAYHLFYNPWKTLDALNTSVEEGLVLFSPFSASCSSRKGEPPNKMLKPDHWVPIISFLRTLGPVRMLGAPEDQPHESWQLSEEEIMTGVPLDLLAATMKKAKLVVTIDNGMGHLASSQDAKHILFYPSCLSLNFIISWGANYTVTIQIEPTQVQAQQLMWSVQRSAKHLLGVK